MNFCKYLLYIACFTIFAACASDNNQATDTTTPFSPVDEQKAEEVVQDAKPVANITEFNTTTFKKLECKVAGNVLENNQKWVPDRDLLIAIVADESTEDPDFGESHRLIRVYDSDKCEIIFNEELPVNISPDYPYYLTSVDSMDCHLIGILGSGLFYVYDMDNNTLSKPLTPQFKGQRYLDDAQSGRILQMKTLGRYVIGHAEDVGTFVYNLTIPKTPKQEQPTAEYMISEQDFASLFVLKASEGNEYAILPSYNPEDFSFELNMLTEEAAPISEQIMKSAQDNRYIVLRKEGEQRQVIAVDMKTKTRIELPTEMASKNAQEVLKWVRTQAQ